MRNVALMALLALLSAYLGYTSWLAWDARARDQREVPPMNNSND